MDLALHIGTTKTGTTSLQRWFAENRAALAGQGICYPVSLGQENHRKLMVHARDTDRPDSSFAQYGVRDDQTHAAFRARLAAAFSAELAAGPDRPRLCVISNEHLYVKINTPGMVRRLHGFLAPLFGRMTVYLHLRPQVDLLVSNASQRARLGQIVSYDTLTRRAVGPGSAYFNYDHVVRIWSDVFGAEAIRVVPFRRFPTMGDILVRDLGIDVAPLAPIARLNTSLDWRTIALANVVHRGLLETEPTGSEPVLAGQVTSGDGTADQGHAAPARRPRTADRPAAGRVPDLFLDDMPGDQPLQIGLKLARELQARFAEANEALLRRCPDLIADDLIPDWSRYDTKPNVHMIAADCPFQPQLLALLQRYSAEIGALKQKIKALETMENSRDPLRLAPESGAGADDPITGRRGAGSGNGMRGGRGRVSRATPPG